MSGSPPPGTWAVVEFILTSMSFFGKLGVGDDLLTPIC